MLPFNPKTKFKEHKQEFNQSAEPKDNFYQLCYVVKLYIQRA